MPGTVESDELAEYWQGQINSWKTSGKSQASFCKAHDLSYHRFTYWRRKFDEAELEVTLGDLADQLPEEETLTTRPKKRKRGFSDKLPRVQIHLSLSDEDKAGASKTFYTKAHAADVERDDLSRLFDASVAQGDDRRERGRHNVTRIAA